MGSLELCADALWGRECLAYHVQGQPDEATVDKLIDLQQHFAAGFPVPLHLIPENALHVSIVTMIAARSEEIQKNALWRRISEEMPQALAALSRHMDRIPIVFRTLEVTPHAIIVSTPEQPPIILELRAGFAALLERLGEPTPRYDRTHITLARYAAGSRIDRATIAQVERQSLDFQAGLSRLRLVREHCYPSLYVDEI